MAKAKTATEPETALAITPPTPRKRGGKPLAVEQHTVVKTWAEEVKIGAPTPTAKSRKQIIADEIEEDEADDIDVELPDEVQEVLAEYNTGDGLIMEVNRLPHYHLNGKQDPLSLVCLGDRDFDPLDYKNILRLYYAKEGVPNFFVLRLKSSDRRWIPGGRIGPINVEAATAEEKARHGIHVVPEAANVVATINQATPPYPYPPPQEPPDPMAGINQTLSLLEKFQAIGLIPKLERGKPEQVTVQQNPPPDPEVAAFSTAMKFASDKTREKLGDAIIGKMIGADISSAPEESIGHLIIREGFTFLMQVVPPLIPTGQQYLSSLAQLEQLKVHQLQMQIHQQQGGAPPASLPESSPQPEAPPQTQEPIPAQQAQPEPEEILFGLIMSDCVKRKIVKPEVCAKNVLAFVDRYITDESGWTPFNAAVDIFLSNDVADIVSFASTQNPIAARLAKEEDVLPWLKAVQDEIRKEWAQQDGEDNQTG